MKIARSLSLALWFGMFATTFANAASTPDLAKLITKSEVEAALKTPVAEPVIRDMAPPTGGKMVLFVGTKKPIKTFHLEVRTEEDISPKLKSLGFTLAKMYKVNKESYPSAKPLTISGGEAFTSQKGSGILKNGVQLVLTTSGGANGKPVATPKDLILKAADRL